MHCVSTPGSNTRERELYRYFQPGEFEHITEAPEGGHRTPRASSDAILTAFAQLGALRFGARRGIITLSTHDTEFILAESSQALSLQQDDDETDRLWHGVGILDKGLQIGPAVTKLFLDPENSPPYVVIGDLEKDDRFKDICATAGARHFRSLACVPLRTPSYNLVIGQYVVVDDKPRDGWSEKDIQFLEDMAVTVMDYLEAGLVKRQQFRAERMVKAIGLFIEGKASLREWWLETGHKLQTSRNKKRAQGSTNLNKQADIEFGVQESVGYFSGNALHGLVDRYSTTPQSPSASSTPSQADRGDGRPSIPRHDTLHSEATGSTTLASHTYEERSGSVTTFDTTDPTTPDPDKQTATVSFDLPPLPVVSTDLPKELQNALLSSDIRSVFNRSSNLIREAIGVDGVIYLDASVSSFGGNFGKDDIEENGPGVFHGDRGALSSEDEFGRRLSEADCDELKEHYQLARTPEKYCNVLGFSTRHRSSLHGHPVSPDHQKFPEDVLRKLLKRYPHGKVFNFNEDGTMSGGPHGKAFSTDGDGPSPRLNSSNPGLEELQKAQKQAHRKKIARDEEAAAILRVLPGARSVFWFPLWDQNRERWFAGSLVWSTCPTRTLCPVEDITYLAAFGNSTMAEISRLSAQVLSKMKTDFISSISHELRSPLHGVLASVELLQETGTLSEFQTDMINNIQASGKVLLDTINHVLDFSKVNRKTKEKKSKPRKQKSRYKRRESVADDAEEKADICVLSEEVIESVYAGQIINKKAFDSSGHRRQTSINLKDRVLTIVVDIQYRANWNFNVDAGAWRRILMNLFSNAMKYTKQGYVKISMEIEDDVAYQKRKPRSNLLLKIKDSGKGISPEFLNHQLFKPFSQEDSLASGAGLGLSIVKAIVQDLGGKLQFFSEHGTGTEAVLRLPLTASKPAKIDGLEVVEEVRRKSIGLKFRLKGFDRYPDISEAPTGILSAEAEATIFLKSSMKTEFTGWFGMDYIPKSRAKDFRADVIVVMESGLGGRTLEEALHTDYDNGECVNGSSIVIVITTGYYARPRMDSHGHFRIFYVQQPFGPHKIAKTLYSALCLPFTQVSMVDNPESATNSPELPSRPSSSGVLSSQANAIHNTSATQDFASLSATTLSPDSQPLPLSTPPPEIDSAKVENLPPKQQETTVIEKSLRVLLVEDNEINLKLLIATMRKLKLDHTAAMNGLEALNAYKDSDGNFDVIFMDISMPVMSGIESSQHIRQYEKEKGLEPVALIALTGAANPSTRQEAFQSGVDLYMTKPVPMKTLRGMLEDLKRDGRTAFANDRF